MANKFKGEVGVEVDGKQYTLRPSTNAMCELETRLGKTLAEVAAAAQTGNLSMGRWMVWAILQACHGEEIQTEQDAGNWIDRAGGIEGIGSTLVAVSVANAPEGGRESAARPRAARAPVGVTSTSRHAASA